MTILLYCFSRHSETNISITGVDGNPVNSISVNGIKCFYSITNQLPSPEELIKSKVNIEEHIAVKYHQVIIKMHELLPILPFRYGTFLDSEKALVSIIEQNTNQIFQAINQFEFTSEKSFLVKVKKKEASQIPKSLLNSDSPGVSYLRNKFKKHGLQISSDHMNMEISEVLRFFFREHLIDLKSESNIEGVKIHLLSIKSWSPEPKIISELALLLKDYSLYYLGDFPPYHFIKLNLTGKESPKK